MRIILSIVLFCCLTQASMAQWVQKASCPYGSFGPGFYFALGTKIYVAKGDSIITWDQTTNTWSFFGIFPGQVRYSQAVTHTNGKAYVISGSTSGGYTNEVWEFDPVTGWTQKSNFPGAGRSSHSLVSHSGNNYIYLSFGSNNSNSYLSDFWQYNPATDTWTQKASAPLTGVARNGHISFINAGGNVVVKFGDMGPNNFATISPAIYSISSNSWTAVGGGLPLNARRYPSVFTIGNEAYAGLGILGGSPPYLAYSDFAGQVVSLSNIANFPGTPSVDNLSVGCNGKGYIGLGEAAGMGYPPFPVLNQLWEYSIPLTITASPGSICSGSSVTLTASGSSNYTWSPGGATGSVTVVSPTVTTIYTLSSTTGQTTKTITVLPSTVLAISGPSLICAGQTATLAVVGATSNYVFNPGSLTGFSVVVTPSASTTYTAFWGCASGTLNVAVFSASTVIAAASSASVCPGNFVVLSCSGASTYTWLPGNVANSDYTVFPTSPTVYSVQASGPGGLCSASQTVSVGISSLSTSFSTGVTPSATLCAGQTATLNVSGPYTSYTWQPGNYTGQNYTVAPIASTIYTVSASGSGSLCSQSETLQVNVSAAMPFTVNVLPSATLCTAQIPTLNVTGPYTNYTCNAVSFSGPNLALPSGSATTSTYTISAGTSTCGASSTITIFVGSAPQFSIITANSLCDSCNGSISVMANGNLASYHFNFSPTVNCTALPCTNLCPNLYHITLSDSAGCSSNKFFSIACSGFRNGGSTGIAVFAADDEQLMIYPNPAASQITLQSVTRAFNYRISNYLGQVIITGSTGEEKTVVSLDGLSKGVYFVEAQSNGRTLRKKLILE